MAQELIDAILRGQQFRTRQREEAEAAEDRGVLKELLQHRLRSIKLEEKMKARELAKENLLAMSGRRQNEVPDSMLQPLTEQQLKGDQSLSMIATMPETITPAQRQMRPMQIPGVEELGVPGFERAPQTMEQMLRDISEKKMAETMGTAYTLGAGGRRMLGDQILAENPRQFAPPNPQGVDIYEPGGGMRRDYVTPQAGMSIDRGTPPDNRNPIRFTDRDEQGWETDRFVRPGDAPTAPPPRRAPTPQSQTQNKDPKGEAGIVLGKTIDNLETIINRPDFVESKDPFLPWNNREFTDSERMFDDAIQQAVIAKATYDSGGNSPTAAAVNAAKEFFGFPKDGVRSAFTRPRLALALKQLKEYVGYRPPRAAGTDTGAKPVIPELEGMVFRDGQWYVKQ